MPNKLTEWISSHPGARWKIRMNCFMVMVISASCIAGHLTGVPVLFSAGLQLGMSAITAVCNILTSLSILVLVREEA